MNLSFDMLVATGAIPKDCNWKIYEGDRECGRMIACSDWKNGNDLSRPIRKIEVENGCMILTVEALLPQERQKCNTVAAYTA